MRAVAKLCSNYSPHQMRGAFRRGIVVACNLVPFGLKPGAGKPGKLCQEFVPPSAPSEVYRAQKPEMGAKEVRSVTEPPRSPVDQ